MVEFNIVVVIPLLFTNNCWVWIPDELVEKNAIEPLLWTGVIVNCATVCNNSV